jgi:hypothetical protein
MLAGACHALRWRRPGVFTVLADIFASMPPSGGFENGGTPDISGSAL